MSENEYAAIGGTATQIGAKEGKENTVNIRPEHIALNVLDPAAVVKWYTENLGMKVMRKGGPPTNTSFIADSGQHMMLELSHNADYPVIDFAQINPLSIHLAFVVEDISTMKATLIAAGATLVEDITETPAGDKVLMMRDPSGLPIQLVKRVAPMLK